MGKKTDKLKDGLKNLKNKEIIIAAIAVAIMLIVYFVGGSGRSQTAKNDEVTGSDYRTETEAKLRDAIVKLSGDENAEIIVSWESGTESLIAYSTTENQNSTTKTPTVVQGGKPIVLKEIYPKAVGAVVVVKGGGEVKTKLDIINAVVAITQMPPENVAVYGAKK